MAAVAPERKPPRHLRIHYADPMTTQVKDLDGLVAGVDLGGTKIQTIVAHGDEIVGQTRLPTPEDGADAVVAAILETIRVAMDAIGRRPLLAPSGGRRRTGPRA